MVRRRHRTSSPGSSPWWTAAATGTAGAPSSMRSEWLRLAQMVWEHDGFRWVVTAAHCVHGNSDKDNKDVWVSRLVIERSQCPDNCNCRSGLGITTTQIRMTLISIKNRHSRLRCDTVICWRGQYICWLTGHKNRHPPEIWPCYDQQWCGFAEAKGQNRFWQVWWNCGSNLHSTVTKGLHRTNGDSIWYFAFSKRISLLDRLPWLAGEHLGRVSNNHRRWAKK